jgi:hypothetical protein
MMKFFIHTLVKAPIYDKGRIDMYYYVPQQQHQIAPYAYTYPQTHYVYPPHPVTRNYDARGFVRQNDHEISRILRMIENQHPKLFERLKEYNLNEPMIQYVFRLIIAYTLDHAPYANGSIDERVDIIFTRFKQGTRWVFHLLNAYRVPDRTVEKVIKNVITLTVTNIGGGNEKPEKGEGWSDWENLGGKLSSGPSASSRRNNRIEVFVRGQDRSLYLKYWNGKKWSDWRSLGGELTSSPAAVSWGPRRIDVFARGKNESMHHKWWNGKSWSNWEDLGGKLTSSPAAASWGPNRIDTFVKGQNHALYHKYWDGSRWSNWESLGGHLTSSPAAVCSEPNRIDVFARGKNHNLYHKLWNGSTWSNWEDLGGQLNSAPAVSSKKPNHLDVFALNRNNQVIYKSWNGRKWSKWRTINGARLTSDLGAISWGPNRVDVFGRGEDQSLMHIWKD